MVDDDDGVSEEARDDMTERVLVAHEGGVNEANEVIERICHDHVGGDNGISGMGRDDDGVSEKVRADVAKRVIVAHDGVVNDDNELVERIDVHHEARGDDVEGMIGITRGLCIMMAWRDIKC